MTHTRRPRIIAFDGSLHGRTRWGINVTGLPMWRIDPFPMGDIVHVPFGRADALEQALDAMRGEIAAVIGEPVQGNGGIGVPPPEFWPAARRLCTAHSALLVLDEVQTGFNRTGRFFACEHWGIAPDIIAISKSLANGFPIAAFATTDLISASFTRPSASTYGGNPVSAAAALATLRFHQKHDLGSRARAMGEMLHTGLVEVARSSQRLRLPHGLGLMIGLPAVEEDGSPSPRDCDRLLERLKDNGVLAGKTGVHRNILTFMPPLTIESEQVQGVIHALQKCVA